MAEYLTALLDSPRSRTMGAVPFVSRDTATGTLRTNGFANRSMRRSVDEDELEELVSAKQASKVASELDLTSVLEVGNQVAFWVGHDFAAEAAELGMPLPLLDGDSSIVTERGFVRVLPAEEVYARIVTWTEQALRSVIRTRSPGVAELMRRVAHDSDVIRTAIWLTTANEKIERTLNWYTRLERDAGHRTSPGSLINRFQSLSKLPRFNRTEVSYGISGKAGSDHRDVARLIHQKIYSDAEVVSFGGYLRQQLQSEFQRAPDKRELQIFGQKLVRTKPFWFAREVLAGADAAKRLVVDGVRHKEIQQALRMMVDRMSFSFVDTDEDKINERLEQMIPNPNERLVVKEFATEQALNSVQYDSNIEDQEAEDARRIQVKIEQGLPHLMQGA